MGTGCAKLTNTCNGSVQFETAAGWELHPDGTQVWSAIRPVEWRAERLTLLQPK